MDKMLLKLAPKKYKCPVCGNWHTLEKMNPMEEWNTPYNLSSYVIDADNCASVEFSICIQHDNLYCTIEPFCDRNYLDFNGWIPISKITEHYEQPIVTFDIQVDPPDIVSPKSCILTCNLNKDCQFLREKQKSDYISDRIELGFEFDKKQYDEIIKKRNKGDLVMDKTSFWDMIYRRSPEENVKAFKEFLAKHDSTLKWLIPTATIYGAYKILTSEKSQISPQNVAKVCKDKLGFELDVLKQKDKLKEMMSFAIPIATAFAAQKGLTALINRDSNDTGDLSINRIDDELSSIGKLANKFSFLQVKIDDFLPIATSVIIVYVMTQKPEWIEVAKKKFGEYTGTFSSSVKGYFEMAKLFVADKLKLDLSNDEGVKKARNFVLLAIVVGIGVFLYGRSMLGKDAITDKKDNKKENQEAFFGNVISILKKLSPTAFSAITSILATKGVIKYTENESSVEETSKGTGETKAKKRGNTRRRATTTKASSSRKNTSKKKPAGGKKTDGTVNPTEAKENTDTK